MLIRLLTSFFNIILSYNLVVFYFSILIFTRINFFIPKKAEGGISSFT